ncbi:hypothetical protein [Paracoccus sp. TOH]|uniref:hypothetical protein n=1 Tax=Paracoccus sp. TOH TaxID=1263728 RepID=UPI0025AF7BF6|nr:hypothetical protein [Paracoccus sp. TOH]WJS85452.1 hypothetical protein NBE95_14910 [Paracoccus sp. TOH]
MESLEMTYLLSDYPVLARLAVGRTEATSLDARACHGLYARAMAADLRAMGPRERRFYDLLSLIDSGGPVAALQARVRAAGFRRMPDEQAFLDDLSGGI